MAPLAMANELHREPNYKLMIGTRHLSQAIGVKWAMVKNQKSLKCGHFVVEKILIKSAIKIVIKSIIIESNGSLCVARIG